MNKFPVELPESGHNAADVLALFEMEMGRQSAILGSEIAFAHMDPPTPAIASRLVGINASLNQNLLHPDLSPLATQVEQLVIDWLTPVFGQQCGHFCAGSTIANLTALWCARESGVSQVVASVDAHISIPKAAHILGLPLIAVPVDQQGRLDQSQLPDLSNAALVLTAGTTGRGSIDGLNSPDAQWRHVDAAWAGPLRLTRHKALLDGIERADSVAVSAHKWLYQPKESALVFFANKSSEELISVGGVYLATPNVGVQGSRGAAAIPLLATLMTWGRSGLASRIEKNMADAQEIASRIEAHPAMQLKQMPETAVINWQPPNAAIDKVLSILGETASRTVIDGETWIRHVAANPSANVEMIWDRICKSVHSS